VTRRSRWALPLVVVLVLGMAGGLATAAAGLGSPGGLQLLTVDEAQANLQAARDALAEAQQRREDLLAEREATEAEIQQLDVDQRDLTERLASLAAQIRQLSVNAYIGGGVEELVILDVAEATDYLFSSRVLDSQVEVRRDITQEYERLRAEAEQGVVDMVNRLDDISAGIEQAQDDIQRFSELIVVRQAELREAQEIARYGRAMPSEGAWQALRVCESHDDYTTDTGNGFYGAYQFTLSTWRSVGGSGNPAQAQPGEQDARARALYARSGAGPWPVCGRHLD
jgi:hypothetical protein